MVSGLGAGDNSCLSTRGEVGSLPVPSINCLPPTGRRNARADGRSAVGGVGADLDVCPERPVPAVVTMRADGRLEDNVG
jgi:hypothetical protein